MGHRYTSEEKYLDLRPDLTSDAALYIKCSIHEILEQKSVSSSRFVFGKHEPALLVETERKATVD